MVFETGSPCPGFGWCFSAHPFHWGKPHDQCTEITTFSWSHSITQTLREPIVGGLVPAWLGGDRERRWGCSAPKDHHGWRTFRQRKHATLCSPMIPESWEITTFLQFHCPACKICVIPPPSCLGFSSPGTGTPWNPAGFLCLEVAAWLWPTCPTRI